jgi:hypothetical protein
LLDWAVYSVNPQRKGTIMRTTKLVVVLFAIALVGACGDDDDNNNQNGTVTTRAAISDCGGFAAAQKTHIPSPGNYCDAELLLWQYSSATGTLNVSNNRIALNCCGEHSMTAAIENGVYVITEQDDPETGGGRCDCECIFDFTAELDDVPAGDVAFRLERYVTDDASAPSVVWSGTIEVHDGTGLITVDGDPMSYPCDASATE